MTIDQFIAALKVAAPNFVWKLDRQRWGDDDRLCLRAWDGDFKTCPIGAVCKHRGRGDFDSGAYVRAANALDISPLDRRKLAFASSQSPLADPQLRGRMLAQVDIR